MIFSKQESLFLILKTKRKGGMMSKQVREELKEDVAKKILKDMDVKYELNKIDELIKDNKIDFKHNDIDYRVRQLTMKDKEELDSLRRKKFGQLIQDKDILLEKDLIKVYKERGLNIEEIDIKLKNLTSKYYTLQIKLGESLSRKEGDVILKKFKEDIENLDREMNILIIQKSTLLEFSLENQLQNYVAKIMTYLSLDKKDEDTYKRAFESLDDFLMGDEDLINQSAAYSLKLHYIA